MEISQVGPPPTYFHEGWLHQDIDKKSEYVHKVVTKYCFLLRELVRTTEQQYYIRKLVSENQMKIIDTNWITQWSKLEKKELPLILGENGMGMFKVLDQCILQSASKSKRSLRRRYLYEKRFTNIRFNETEVEYLKINWIINLWSGWIYVRNSIDNIFWTPRSTVSPIILFYNTTKAHWF